MNCECTTCRSACERSSGLFAFGEAERAAKSKGVTLGEFYRQYLRVDYAIAGTERVLMLAPATTDTGACVFYQDGKCSIQQTKPEECRRYDHTLDKLAIGHYRFRILKTWDTPEAQRQVAELGGSR